MANDIQDWKITFVDTGLNSNIGKRLKLVEKFVRDEEVFLANYSDGLTDLPLPKMVDDFTKSGRVGSFLCAPPSQTFHVVTLGEKNLVKDIQYVKDSGLLVNAGYFVFRKEIFNYLNMGEELVLEPFQRLIAKGLLQGFRYDNFWAMDTFKEQQELSDMFNRGKAHWEVWKTQA